MPSLTDDLMERAAGQAADKGPKAVKKAANGICLILGKGSQFTTEKVMKTIRNKAFKKTGDIRYSEQNISIAELMAKGTVKKIDEAVTADVMRYFDRSCKENRVKYCAMKDEHEAQDPQYYIFYEGKTADVILHVMQEAYKDYMADQEKKDKGTDHEKEDESIRAKLSFFRDRAADLGGDAAAIEKPLSHQAPQR